MNIEIFNKFLSQHFIQAVCKTLLHSLWQGLLLAIFTGMVLMLTKRSRPVFRYNLLFLGLMLFVSANAVTFFIEMTTHVVGNSAVVIDSAGNSLEAGRRIFIQYGYAVGDSIALLSYVDKFITGNAAIIFGIWLVVFSCKSLRAAGGLWFIHSLQTRDKTEPDKVWFQHLNLLAGKLGIKRAVKLFESGLVSVPMVTGVLSPIIFVPLGFFANLPAEQIEAILLHELAHIKRRDYLVNLFQSFGENIYFFNPAVIWISALIREEREHCCDDLAISVLQNQSSFIQALVSFQEYKIFSASPAMAFPGRKNHLLDRIKRIIYKNNKPLNAMEKLFVTASLLTATLLSAAFSPGDTKLLKVENKSEITSRKQESNEMDLLETTKRTEKRMLNDQKLISYDTGTRADTLPGKYERIQINSGVSNIETTKNNKRYEIQEVDGKVTSLKVDGKSIPEDEINLYQKDLNKISVEVKDQREKAEVARQDAEKARGAADVMRKQADGMRIEAEKMREAAGKMRVEAEKMRGLADLNRKQAEETRGLAELARIEAGKQRINAEDMRKLADISREKAEDQRVIAEESRKHAELARKEAEKNRVAFEKLQSELITDLKAEGIIKGKSDFSYKLNNEELVVNGIKQSAAVHQKFKNKYVKESGWEIMYNTNGRTGYSITK